MVLACGSIRGARLVARHARVRTASTMVKRLLAAPILWRQPMTSAPTRMQRSDTISPSTTHGVPQDLHLLKALVASQGAGTQRANQATEDIHRKASNRAPMVGANQKVR